MVTINPAEKLPWYGADKKGHAPWRSTPALARSLWGGNAFGPALDFVFTLSGHTAYITPTNVQIEGAGYKGTISEALLNAVGGIY